MAIHFWISISSRVLCKFTFLIAIMKAKMALMILYYSRFADPPPRDLSIEFDYCCKGHSKQKVDQAGSNSWSQLVTMSEYI